MRSAARLLLPAICALLALSHVPGASAQQPKFGRLPDKSKPCLYFYSQDGTEAIGTMLSTSRCPKDNFSLAWVTASNDRLFATSVPAGPANVSMGGYLAFTRSPHAPDLKVDIAVVRQADGKQVVPKALMPGGRLADISSTKRSVCMLFNKGTNVMSGFRMSTSLDGTRVINNSFYRGDRSPSGEPGVPCGQYFETGPPAVEGRTVDVYSPSSCQIVIDDCS